MIAGKITEKSHKIKANVGAGDEDRTAKDLLLKLPSW